MNSKKYLVRDLGNQYRYLAISCKNTVFFALFCVLIRECLGLGMVVFTFLSRVFVAEEG